VLRPCHFCGHPLEETYRVCTECGRPNRTPKQVRRLGWVLVGIGAFLVVFMAGLSFVVGRIIARSGNPEATTRFTGDASQAAIMFGIFAFIALFGVLGMAAGASQIRHGKVNRRMVTVVLILGVTIFVGGQLSLIFL
jgi:predicted nucleic acid-binding Zn ribbon protein